VRAASQKHETSDRNMPAGLSAIGLATADDAHGPCRPPVLLMNVRLPMQKLSFDKRRIKFLFLEGIHANATNALTADGYASVRSLPKSLTGDALKTALKDVHFLGIRSRTEITEEMLAAAPKLAAIGCFCIGTNQVDLAAAAKALGE